jgi:hypothetical protein
VCVCVCGGGGGIDFSALHQLLHSESLTSIVFRPCQQTNVRITFLRFPSVAQSTSSTQCVPLAHVICPHCTCCPPLSFAQLPQRGTTKDPYKYSRDGADTEDDDDDADGAAGWRVPAARAERSVSLHGAMSVQSSDHEWELGSDEELGEVRR